MNNLRIGAKLTIIFSIILVLIVSLGYFAWTFMKEIESENILMREQSLPAMRSTTIISTGIVETRLAMQAYVLNQNPEMRKALLAKLAETGKSINAGEELSTRFPEMKVYAKGISELRAGFDLYSRLLQETQIVLEKQQKEKAIIAKEGSALLGQFEDFVEDAAVYTAPERAFMRDTLFKFTRLRISYLLSQSAAEVTKVLEELAALENFLLGKSAFIENTAMQQKLATFEQGLEAYKQTLNGMRGTWVWLEKQDKTMSAVAETGYSAALQLEQAGANNANKVIATIVEHANEAKTDIAWLSIVTFLFSVIVACFIGFDLTRILNQCVSFTQRISQGHFDERWHPRRNDEFGQLANALNTAFDKVVAQTYWFQGILNALPFGLATMDTDRRFTFANTNVQKILGKNLEELKGQPCHTWGASICKTDKCSIECCLRGEKDVEFHQTGLGYFKAMAVELRDTNQNIIGYVDMAFDINEEKRLAAEASEALVKGRMAAAASLENVVQRVSVASEQLSAQITQSDRSTTQTAHIMETTATAMEEMASTVGDVAQNATDASETTAEMRTKARDGATIVQEVVSGISTLEQLAVGLQADMSTLEQQAQGIGQIMTTISDIADQTNLLALNAAIEAARAGEAGRGFAVVADEVRKLAEKTMQATAEVDKAISNIQSSAHKNKENVISAVQAVHTTTNLANTSGATLQALVSMAENTADRVRVIATATEQQSVTADEINQSIVKVNANTAELATAMRESAGAIDELAQQANVLKDMVTTMKQG